MVTTRTDALGQQAQYTYDSYGRLSEVQYFKPKGGSEYTNQRVNYYYDNTLPPIGQQLEFPTQPTFPQNSMGRLSAVVFGGGVTDAYQDYYYYLYNHNQAGRVTAQLMGVQLPNYNSPYTWMSFNAAY